MTWHGSTAARVLVDADLFAAAEGARLVCDVLRRAARAQRRRAALIESAAEIARIAIEQQRAHQALRHSEARNSAILRAIPDWMFLTTVEGVFLDYPRQGRSQPARASVQRSLDRTSSTCCLPDRRDAGAGVRTRRRSRTNPRRSSTRWGPTTTSASSKRASSAATATRSSASSGTSPIASARSWKPARSAASWRI